MKDKNRKNSRLTPEQEAELVYLFISQKKLQSRIVAVFSNLVSNYYIPFLIMEILDSDFPIFKPLKRLVLEQRMWSTKDDIKYNVNYYYRLSKEAQLNFDKYNSYIQDLLRGSGLKDMGEYIARVESNVLYSQSIKNSLASYYRYFACSNLQNIAIFSFLKCIYPTESELSQVITSYSKKTLSKLYSLTTREVSQLKQQIEKYSPHNFRFSQGLSLSEVYRYGSIHLVKFGFVAVATISFETFITRPFLVKFMSLFNTKRLTDRQIFSLTESEASSLITKLKDERQKLSALVLHSDLFSLGLPAVFLLAFAYQLAEQGFDFYIAAVLINVLLVLIKDLAVWLRQRNADSRLDSALHHQRLLLNQVSYVSGRNNWSIHKGASLDTSYLVLNLPNKDFPKELCDVIKYALLINGINIVADDRSCIVVSGNEKLEQQRVRQATENIRETLSRLDKLKTLKKQFQTLANHMNGKHNFYMKRGKNHSIIGVFEQEITSDHRDSITLESCKQIFLTHQIKIKDDKLSIIGFEPLGAALQAYKLLFARKKVHLGFVPTSSSTNDSPTSRFSSFSPKSSSTSSQAKPTTPPQKENHEVVKWPRNYTYDSQKPSCQIYKFFSSGKSKLFLVSELSAEDFADPKNYEHYLNKIKDPRLASEQKGQGAVKIPDLCARDRHGHRFFASWKYRFKGAMGDQRPLCEVLKSATGEKLLIVRAVSDHKDIERMQKNSSKTI
jgi:hypothetical protein